MYYTFTVPVPQVKGKIITKKKADATYILYQYGQQYSHERKYAIPKRTIIGKRLKDDPQLMYPNNKFQDYFPDACIPEVLPESNRSCALKTGTYTVIQKVLEEYRIPELCLCSRWLSMICSAQMSAN